MYVRFFLSLITYCVILSASAFAHSENGVGSTSKNEFSPSFRQISALFPLGKAMIGLDGFTRDKPILTQTQYSRLPQLVEDDTENTYFALKLVSFRISPCETESDPERCVPQVRFVFQPTIERIPGHFFTRDAAVHITYEIANENLLRLVRGLVKLDQENQTDFSNAASAIHPGLAKNSLSSSYGKKWRKLMADALAESNLSRVTFMSVLASQIWDFAGFDTEDGNFLGIPVIPGSEYLGQQVIVPAGTLKMMANPGPAQVMTRLTPFRERPADASNDLTKRAQEEIASVEDPHRSSTKDVSCLDCHTANRLRMTWGEAASLSVEGDAPAPTDAILTRIGVFRAFGYFDQTPVMNRRTFLETVQSLEMLKRQMAQ